MKQIFLIVIFLNTLSLAIAQNKQNVISKTYFSLCEAEYGKCIPGKKCRIDLISGSKIALGSYIKVYYEGNLITEGYILKHRSGRIFIFKNKEEVKEPEIYGGCSDDGYYEISITAKEIWGC
jgi:hypothetical protein